MHQHLHRGQDHPKEMALAQTKTPRQGLKEMAPVQAKTLKPLVRETSLANESRRTATASMAAAPPQEAVTLRRDQRNVDANIRRRKHRPSSRCRRREINRHKGNTTNSSNNNDPNTNLNATHNQRQRTIAATMHVAWRRRAPTLRPHPAEAEAEGEARAGVRLCHHNSRMHARQVARQVRDTKTTGT